MPRGFLIYDPRIRRPEGAREAQGLPWVCHYISVRPEGVPEPNRGGQGKTGSSVVRFWCPYRARRNKK